MAIIRKKRILFAVLAVIVIAFIFTETKKVYGNDEESIIKVIQSIDGYNYPSIQLLEMKDIKNERVVPFLFNNGSGYIQFTKNKRGNYEWTHIEKKEDPSFATYLIHLQGVELPQLKYLLVAHGPLSQCRRSRGINTRNVLSGDT